MKGEAGLKKEFICEWDQPIVETKAGKLRGFYWRGTYQFRGIRYATAERFLPPCPVQPWNGVQDCFCYGKTAPTIDNTNLEHMDIALGYRFWPQDEDCLFLNIWTDDINSSAQKPVMFFIHGGRFANGSSIEHEVYEAERLCKEEDVVAVSINHRLNILGFLDLSEYGEKYHNSGNAGMEDIVAALQWVRANIAQFGGDPDNVTIFGQSGGGAKVNGLMQVPSAANLFHKAIIQSGVLDTREFPERHEGKAKVAQAVVENLGLTRETSDEIQKVSYAVLTEAFLKAVPGLEAEGVCCDWAPVINDYYYGTPYENPLTEKAKNTPTIIGTNMAETLLWDDVFYDRRMSEENKLALLQGKYGERYAELVEAFKRSYPGKDLLDLLSLDTYFRIPALHYTDRRAEEGTAPVYSYVLSYTFDLLGGLPAWHAAEHSIVFKSYERLPVMAEKGISLLSDQIAGAWAAFAHTGNPENPYLPKWTPYTAQRKSIMVFDRTSEEKIDFDRETVELCHELAPHPYAPRYVEFLQRRK